LNPSIKANPNSSGGLLRADNKDKQRLLAALDQAAALGLSEKEVLASY
jgi:hypothetical protein